MSLIAGKSLYKLIEDGYISADPENVNAASIDITLGDKALCEDMLTEHTNYVDLAKKEIIAFDEITITDDGIIVYPNQFLQCCSQEVFNLPENISCQFVMKSSMARNGLDHLNSGWCDAGFNNSVFTYSLKNLNQFHPLLLTIGMKIGQLKFYEHEPAGDNCYSKIGSYNDRKAPVAK